MNAFYSPFIIPLGAFVMVLGIVLTISISKYHQRKLQSEERMAAIARGIPLPPEPVDVEMAAWSAARTEDPRLAASKSRKAGIILVAIGIGIIVGLVSIAWLVNERDVLAGCIGGIIPLFIGLGLLLDYALQTRDLEREDAKAKQPTRG